MKKVLFLVCIAVAATFTQKATAQAGAVKIAYVSVDEVVQLMPEYLWCFSS